MLWVGLTGGIASGKSTVAQFLKQEGAYVIDADLIVHALLREDRAVYTSILKAFGEGVLNAEKRIDRKKLGDLVFRKAEQRERLNQIVHPFVFQKTEAEKEAIVSRHPKAVIVFDAALLIETGSYKKMDWVLLAHADPQTQMRRLIERDGLTMQDAALRIAAQMPIDEKIPYADEVIDCTQARHKVQASVRQIYKHLEAKAAGVSSSA